MRFFCIGFFMLVVGQFAQAQDCTATLSGKVIDSSSREPLNQAVVYLKSNGNYLYTDKDGTFKFKNVCPGQETVVVAHPRFENLNLEIEITPGQNTRTFQLRDQLETLQVVHINGQRFSKNTVTAQEQSLDKETLEAYSSKNLGDALEEISGVSSLKTGNSVVKPIIQGFHSSRVLMMNHGVQMQDQEWGMEHAPNIDINSVGKLSVVKGAAALEYGGSAVGGAVIAEAPQIALKDSLYGKTILSGDSNGRGGAVSTSLTRSYQNGWYGRLQGTFKKYGDRRAPEYILSNTGNQEEDFSAQLGLDRSRYGFDAYYSFYNSEIGILRASHIGNAGDLVTAINSEEPYYIRDFTYDINPPLQKLNHHLAKVEAYYKFPDVGKLTAQYSFQKNHREEYDIRRGDDKNKPAVDLELTTHNFKTNFEFNSWTDYYLKFGLQGGIQNNFADPDTGVRRLIPDYDQTDLGLFVNGHYHFQDDWLLEAGIRFDYRHLDALKYYRINRWNDLGYDNDFSNLIIDEVNSQYLTNPVFDFTVPSATVGLRYDIDEERNLKLNYSLAGRPPNPAELFSDGLHHSSAVIEFGDLRIDPEYAHKLSLGYERKSENFQWNIAPYFSVIKNFINMEPTGLLTTIRGAFPVWEYKQINALLGGIDIDAQYRLSDDLAVASQFSYVYGQNQTGDDPLINMPPANWKNKVSYGLQDWHNFKATLSGNLNFRQWRYPDNNFTHQSIDDGQEVERLVDISTPPDAYFLMDFSAGMDFQPFDEGNLNVTVNVQNLLNTTYKNYLNRQRYYAAALGTNVNLQLIFNY